MATTPPGWHADPQQPGRLRWWDGAAWTDHFSGSPAVGAPGAPMGAPPPLRRRGPSLAVAIPLIALGLAGVVVGGVVAGLGLFRTITTTDAMDVPGRGRFHLDSGTYLVYERTGTQSGGGGAGGVTFSQNSGVTIAPGNVRVSGPSEQTLRVRRDSGATETITRGSQVYTGAVAFEVPTEGDYEVAVLNSRPGRALIAPSLSDTFGRALPWVAVAVVGALVGLVGVILLVVGSVRRSRDRLAIR